MIYVLYCFFDIVFVFFYLYIILLCYMIWELYICDIQILGLLMNQGPKNNIGM